MCERRKPESDYLDDVLAWSRILKVKETPCPVPQPRPAVVVHANAEDVPASERKCDLEIVKLAASEAYKQLILGKVTCSTDAVEVALKHVGSFYQGFYKVENPWKRIESDAAILEDNYLKIGSVGAVRSYEYPITLAKYVMKNTNHVLIVSEGADLLVEELSEEDKGSEGSLIEVFKTALEKKKEKREEQACDPNDKKCVNFAGDEEQKVKESIIIKDHQSEAEGEGGEDEAEDNYKKKIASSEVPKEDEDENVPYKIKTYGSIAYDLEKSKSCGVNVFRTDPKLYGRVSATAAVVGCGFYGNDDGGCVCVSGEDGVLYSQAPARTIVESQTDEITLKQSMEKSLNLLQETLGDAGKTFGAAGIDAYGSPTVFFNAQSFPWAYCVNHTMFYGCDKQDFLCERVIFPEDPDPPFKCCCSGDEEMSNKAASSESSRGHFCKKATKSRASARKPKKASAADPACTKDGECD